MKIVAVNFNQVGNFISSHFVIKN